MQRRPVMMFLASLAAVVFLGCAKDSAGPTPAELKRLTVDQVAARLAAPDGKTFIYDNNAKESWVKGHVPTATWLDDENVTATTLPADKAATLIFYCHNET